LLLTLSLLVRLSLLVTLPGRVRWPVTLA